VGNSYYVTTELHSVTPYQLSSIQQVLHETPPLCKLILEFYLRLVSGQLIKWENHHLHLETVLLMHL
jgi:hypothetical protein